MNKSEVNTLRLTGHEIIIALMDARELRSLEMLESHLIKAIDKVRVTSGATQRKKKGTP